MKVYGYFNTSGWKIKYRAVVGSLEGDEEVCGFLVCGPDVGSTIWLKPVVKEHDELHTTRDGALYRP